MFELFRRSRRVQYVPRIRYDYFETSRNEVSGFIRDYYSSAAYPKLLRNRKHNDVLLTAAWKVVESRRKQRCERDTLA